MDYGEKGRNVSQLYREVLAFWLQSSLRQSDVHDSLVEGTSFKTEIFLVFYDKNNHDHDMGVLRYFLLNNVSNISHPV